MTGDFQPLPLPTERVYVEIIGGDFDGGTLDSQSPDATEREQVKMLLLLTNNGEIGKGMQGASLTHVRKLMERTSNSLPTPGVTHYYFVTERLDEDNELLIRMTYKSKKWPQPKPPEQQDA